MDGAGITAAGGAGIMMAGVDIMADGEAITMAGVGITMGGEDTMADGDGMVLDGRPPI